MNFRLILVFGIFFIHLVSAQVYDQINDSVDSILDRIPPGTNYSIFAYDPMTGDTVLARNINTPMIPASNAKLFTTAAALYYMGMDYKVKTTLYSTDNNIRDGVIQGDLYIKGHGNPFFSSADLKKLADELVDKGVERITGNIYGDESFFDEEYLRNDWIEGEGAAQLAPVSALSLNGNMTSVKKKVRRRYRTVSAPVSNPARHTAQALFDILINKGVKIGGGSGVGITPEKSTEVATHSLPLSTVLSITNKRSDNFAAECLFKMVGAAASQSQGNATFANQAILGFLKDNSIFVKGTKIADGSGLSRANNVSTLQIVRLLEFMYVDIERYEQYITTLSIAGIDGTLGGRMHGTDGEGNFRGKTGTLNGISTVAGYLTTRDGTDLIVSIMFSFSRNGWNYYRGVQDEIIEALAGSEFAPTPASKKTTW